MICQFLYFQSSLGWNYFSMYLELHRCQIGTLQMSLEDEQLYHFKDEDKILFTLFPFVTFRRIRKERNRWRKINLVKELTEMIMCRFSNLRYQQRNFFSMKKRQHNKQTHTHTKSHYTMWFPTFSHSFFLSNKSWNRLENLQPLEQFPFIMFCIWQMMRVTFEWRCWLL